MLTASTISQSRFTSTTSDAPPGTSKSEAVEKSECAEWVRQAKNGDRQAWDCIVEAFHQRIYHYLVSFMANPHDAQDVTQDTFVKVYRKLHQHREGSSFTSWIFTVARRTALNHFRDRKTGEEIPEDLSISTDSPSERAALSDDARHLWTFVQDLKPNARQALWLRYGEGLSIQEIADVMGKTSLYIRVLVHRAKQDLTKKMEATSRS